jgi:WD40 repeat protein
VITFTASEVDRGLTDVTFSPDGQLLAVRDGIGIISLHTVASGQELVSRRVHSHRSFGFWGGPVRRTLFATCTREGIIPLDPDRKDRRPALDGSAMAIGSVFAPDGTRAISGPVSPSASMLTGYTVSSERVERAWGRRMTDPVGKLSRLGPLCFLPDGDRFLVQVLQVDGTDHERLLLGRWSDKADRVSCAVPMRPVRLFFRAVSPDGGRVIYWHDSSGEVRVYRTDDLTRRPEEYLIPPKEGVYSRAGTYHPSGEFLAVTNGDEVLFLDAGTFHELRTYDWKVGGVRNVAFAPDGALAAACSDTGKVVVWDVDI